MCGAGAVYALLGLLLRLSFQEVNLNVSFSLQIVTLDICCQCVVYHSQCVCVCLTDCKVQTQLQGGLFICPNGLWQPQYYPLSMSLPRRSRATDHS